MPLTEHQKTLNQRRLLELRIDLLLRWLLKDEALDSSNAVTTALMSFDENYPFPKTKEEICARLSETAQAYVKTYPAEQQAEPKVEAYADLQSNAALVAQEDDPTPVSQFIGSYNKNDNFPYFNPDKPNAWRAYFEAQVAQPSATKLTDVVVEQQGHTRVLETIELEDVPWRTIYNLDAIQNCLGENFSITNADGLNGININPFADIKTTAGFPVVPMQKPGTDEIHFCKIKNGKIFLLKEAEAAKVDAFIQDRLKTLLSNHGYQLPGEPMHGPSPAPAPVSATSSVVQPQVKAVGKVRGEESGNSPADDSGNPSAGNNTWDDGTIDLSATPGGMEALTIAAQSVDEGTATITGGDLSNQIQENYTPTQQKSIDAYNLVAMNLNILIKPPIISRLDKNSRADLRVNYSDLIDLYEDDRPLEEAFSYLLSERAMEAFMRVAGTGVNRENDDPENDVSQIILNDLTDDLSTIIVYQKEANQSSIFSNKNQEAVEKQRGYQNEISKWIEFGAKLAYYHSKNQAYPAPGPVFAHILSRINEYNKFINFEEMDEKSKVETALKTPLNALIVLRQYKNVKEIGDLLKYFAEMDQRYASLNTQADNPAGLMAESSSPLYTPNKFMNDYNKLAGELNIFIRANQPVYIEYHESPQEIHVDLADKVAMSADDESNMQKLLGLSNILRARDPSLKDKLITTIQLLEMLHNIAVQAQETSTLNYFDTFLPHPSASGAERKDMAPLLQRLYDMMNRYPADADKTWLSKQQKELLQTYYPDNTTVRRFVGIDEPIARRDRTVEKVVELQDMTASTQPTEPPAGSGSRRRWVPRFNLFRKPSFSGDAPPEAVVGEHLQATSSRDSGDHDDELIETTAFRLNAEQLRAVPNDALRAALTAAQSDNEAYKDQLFHVMAVLEFSNADSLTTEQTALKSLLDTNLQGEINIEREDAPPTNSFLIKFVQDGLAPNDDEEINVDNFVNGTNTFLTSLEEIDTAQHSNKTIYELLIKLRLFVIAIKFALEAESYQMGLLEGTDKDHYVSELNNLIQRVEAIQRQLLTPVPLVQQVVQHEVAPQPQPEPETGGPSTPAAKADPMAGMNDDQKALADEMMKRLSPHIKDEKLQKNVCDFVNNLKGGLLGTSPDDLLRKIKTKGQDLKQAIESAQMESWDNSRNWIVNKFAESAQQPKKKGWFFRK